MLCDETASFTHLVFAKPGGVFQVHLFFPQWRVAGGQSQATQCVASGTPLLDYTHDVVFYRPSERNTCGADANVCAAVNDALRSTLRKE